MPGRTIAAALAIAVGLGAATTASGAHPLALDQNVSILVTDQSDRVAPPRRVTIIGDSAMAGLRWNGALRGLRGFDADDRLQSCRRLVDRSCFGREGRRPDTVLLEVGQLPPPLPNDVLIIAVGYNDFDTKFAEQSRRVLSDAVSRGFRTVAWVTYREDVSYVLPQDTDRAVSNYRNMNAELRRIVASNEYPALVLWDLNEYTIGADSVFTSDGIHQREYGSWLIADWISRKIAALDGRPCPVPWTPTTPNDAECPDPNSVLSSRGYPAVGDLYDF